MVVLVCGTSWGRNSSCSYKRILVLFKLSIHPKISGASSSEVKYLLFWFLVSPVVGLSESCTVRLTQNTLSSRDHQELKSQNPVRVITVGSKPSSVVCSLRRQRHTTSYVSPDPESLRHPCLIEVPVKLD